MTKETEAPAVHEYDSTRAEAVNEQFYALNEVSQIHMLQSVQIVLLQDIRYHLENIEQLLRNR